MLTNKLKNAVKVVRLSAVGVLITVSSGVSAITELNGEGQAGALPMPLSSVHDVMMMAECGGFFNAYGSMIGHEKLFKTGSRLAAQVMHIEEDKRSVALSFERGSEFADTLHQANAHEQIAGYIRDCSIVVARNGVYLGDAS